MLASLAPYHWWAISIKSTWSSYLSNLLFDFQSPIEINQHSKNLFLSNSSKITLDTLQTSPNAIERDEKGRPIRRGFVPVEEKIQTELRDLKNRETELKIQRKQKLRDSKSNLLDYDER